MSKSSSLNFCGCVVLFATSLPTVTKDSAKILGLGLSMALLGLGTGGIKATVSPFIGGPSLDRTLLLCIDTNYPSGKVINIL